MMRDSQVLPELTLFAAFLPIRLELTRAIRYFPIESAIWSQTCSVEWLFQRLAHS